MTDSESDLRRWRLPRGRHGLPRELVTRSQRERLLAAVVRVAAAQGYEATSVADILEEAGVGRESFYELFADKKECMLAARSILVDDLAATIEAAYRESGGSWTDRVRDGLAAMLDWFAADPAAARVVIVELAAIGPDSRKIFQDDFARFTKLLDDGLEASEPVPGLPQATGLAIGGALARVYGEVVRDRAGELPRMLPELTYEMLVPFVGEEAAKQERRQAEVASAD
ncbi:MAG TPA: TetR/AcrR family transcriptional regulator [Solirubrobacterales bacterium]|nr:TetR/AcrR family transcriptional regulator [Solirubrobacterales bacterium]